MKALAITTLLLWPTLSLAQEAATSCNSENHRAFDFWLGNWNVKNADGSEAGRNTIDKIQDGCLVRENWISATAGYSGTSYNYYDRERNQWRQLWIDNQGASLMLTGSRIGNQMILRSADALNKDNKSYFNRITWTANEDGSVRQLWEQIIARTEGGSATAVVFDGLYIEASTSGSTTSKD